jgi:aminoglycoside 3-N-acetyltransferase
MLTKTQLLEGFQKSGIQRGDTIMVHTSYKSLGGVEGGAETVVHALLDLVGAKGTVLFPTFNFQSWTEGHYFDILETPSKMGAITEVARLRADALRTPHPIYSFAVLGRRKEEFAACEDKEAYGPNSVFALFHKTNGTILSIGLDFNSTFSIHHYVEYNVGCDYRRIKEFSGIYVGYDRQPRITVYSMFVRKNRFVKTYIVPGMNELLEKGILREIEVGKAKVHVASAQDFYQNMSVIIREHPEKLHYIEKPSF